MTGVNNETNNILKIRIVKSVGQSTQSGETFDTTSANLDGTKGKQWQGETTEFGNTKPNETSTSTSKIYVVKKGENISIIAKNNGITLGELKAANPQIKDFNKIQIGQKINIPLSSTSVQSQEQKPVAKTESNTQQTQTKTQNPKYYTIQSGDSLSKIAKKFGVDMKLLQKVNFIENPNSIQAGKELYIPENFTKEQIQNKIRTKAKELGIDESLALALADKESTFNPYAKSKTGAAGLFQLTESAINQLKKNGLKKSKKTYDIDLNVDYGLRYFKWCLDTCHGDVKEALVSYNKGYGVMKQAKDEGKDVDSFAHKGNPAWYAKDVLSRQKKYQV